MTTTMTTTRRRLPGGTLLEYTTTGDVGDGAVVFIHGWPDSWRSFEPVMSELPADLPAVSVSLRGFGASEAADGRFGLADLAADVVELLDVIGVRRAVVVGHSMGTLVAQRVAAARPAVVAGVVLIGGFSRIEQGLADEVWSAVEELSDPIPEDFVREFQSSTLAVPVPDDLFDRIVAASLEAPAAVWRATFEDVRTVDQDALLASIAAPVLLLWGEHDALIPRREQDRLLAALADVALIVYAGYGHSPNWEQPQQVADDIVAFVRGRTDLAGSR